MKEGGRTIQWSRSDCIKLAVVDVKDVRKGCDRPCAKAALPDFPQLAHLLNDLDVAMAKADMGRKVARIATYPRLGIGQVLLGVQSSGLSS